MYGLPIVCSRRDYVFDVCTPLLTFDPENVESIRKSLKLAIEKKITY